MEGFEVVVADGFVDCRAEGFDTVVEPGNPRTKSRRGFSTLQPLISEAGEVNQAITDDTVTCP